MRIITDISNKTYRFTGCKKFKTLRIKLMSRSELKFFIDTFFGTKKAKSKIGLIIKN